MTHCWFVRQNHAIKNYPQYKIMFKASLRFDGGCERKYQVVIKIPNIKFYKVGIILACMNQLSLSVSYVMLPTQN